MRAAVVPCSWRKLDRPARVEELYRGPLFRSALLAAQALKRDGAVDRVLVLSARHGLVSLDRVLAPYDLKMGDPGSVEPACLRRQLLELERATGAAVVELVPLLPRAYDEALRAGAELAVRTGQLCAVLPNPLTGSAGLLEQRGRLRRLREQTTKEETTCVC